MKLRTALVTVGIVALAGTWVGAQTVTVGEDGGVRVKDGDDEVVIGADGGVHARDHKGDDVTISPDGTVRAHEDSTGDTVKVSPDGTVRAKDGDSGESVKVRGGNVTVTDEGPAGVTEGEITCSKNQTLTISNRRVRTDGTAIVASGNCSIEISEAKIESAAAVAIRLSGNATVKIHDSKIEGGQYAIWLSGNADASARDSVFIGEIETRANSDFDDQGNNQFLDARE
jgi:hypothetical protein